MYCSLGIYGYAMPYGANYTSYWMIIHFMIFVVDDYKYFNEFSEKKHTIKRYTGHLYPLQMSKIVGD